MYAVSDITYCYDTRPVLQELSIRLPAGRLYGILGPNGCGKSTLVDLLVGHRRAVSGHVRFKAADICGYSKKVLAREIAMVPQNFYINFPFTAEEVVMMGRYPHIPRFSHPTESDYRIVESAMATTRTRRFVNQRITQLSGGERQRVLIARALAQDTPVLILDEATSNLDIDHAIALLNRIQEDVDKRQKTVIAVLQDINLAALFCDHLIFLKNGRVFAEGPVVDILTEETLHQVFGVHTRVMEDDTTGRPHVVFKRQSHA